MGVVTALTPTIPGRENLLAEAVRSVNAQTVPVHAHLIRCQRPSGEAAPHLCSQFNALLPAVDTEWVAVLADDDLWLPNYVEALEPAFESADVVYSWDVGGMQPRIDCTDWSNAEIFDHLNHSNFIAATAAIRTSALRSIGGWPTNWEGANYRDGGHFAGSPAHAEDWELWRRLAAAGARFRCVPVETWQGRPGDWPRMTTVL
jgi:hypothetical protein